MSPTQPTPEQSNKFPWAFLLFIVVATLCVANQHLTAAAVPVSQKTLKQGTLVEPTRGPIVVLSNGGLLVAQPVGIIGIDLQLDSELFGKVELPTDSVAGILFHSTPGTKARDRAIAKILRQNEDRVTLVNGDQLDGPVLGIKGQQITVETAFGRTDIATDRVASIVFGSKEQAEKAPAQVLTGWSDGSRFSVAKLVRNENNRVQVWPYSETQTPWTAKPDQLCFTQPLDEKELVYLSDLTPTDYLHTPFLDRRLPLGRDRNVLGLPLRTDGTLYLKGLGMASQSKITYTLEEPFTRLEASLAIDDSAQNKGSVIFRVLLDGKPVYTSTTVRGGQPPLPISIDTTDAKQLELQVDYADHADQLDHANWLDARLYRKPSTKEP